MSYICRLRNRVSGFLQNFLQYTWLCPQPSICFLRFDLDAGLLFCVLDYQLFVTNSLVWKWYMGDYGHCVENWSPSLMQCKSDEIYGLRTVITMLKYVDVLQWLKNLFDYMTHDTMSWLLTRSLKPSSVSCHPELTRSALFMNKV